MFSTLKPTQVPLPGSWRIGQYAATIGMFMYPKQKLAMPCMAYVGQYLPNSITLCDARTIKRRKGPTKMKVVMQRGRIGSLGLIQLGQCGKRLKEIGILASPWL